MQSNQLKRIHPNKKRMTVARGGKRGKTAGRGGKGQSARAGNKRRPEWRDIIKRVPKLRGRGKNSNKPFQERSAIVNLSVLESVFSAKDLVTPTILVEKGVISTSSGNIPMVKILGDGEMTKAINVSGCFISESAKAKIEKAGGSVVAMASNSLVKAKTEAKVSAQAPKPKEEKAPVKKVAEKKVDSGKTDGEKKESKTKKADKPKVAGKK